MTEPPSIDRFVRLALDCVHREYPNRVGHLLRADADARPPRELTPAFYGCFDWHSAVHGHWLLAAAAGHAVSSGAAASSASSEAAPARSPLDGAPVAAAAVSCSSALREAAMAALRQSLTEERVAAEMDYLRTRPGFERPYGLAWLCALHTALAGSREPGFAELAETLRPLVWLAVGHVAEWLPKLSAPSRSGVHSQTAFALGLWLDWARAEGLEGERALFEGSARRFFAGDRDYAVHFEPAGEDFLSPSLGAADLMSRVIETDEAFAAWLDRAVPSLGRDHGAWLRPAVVTDPSDGRLAHLDGLNSSRAWMLRRVGRALPAADPRRPSIAAAAREHAAAGWAAVSDAHYEGSHWLGTFATYLALVPEPT